MTQFVYFLLALFYPIAFPMSKVLDYLFGDEVTDGNITRSDLEALVMIQSSEYKRSGSFYKSSSPKIANNGHGPTVLQTPTPTPSSPPTPSRLTDVEVLLMTGVLQLSRHTAKNAMRTISDVFMLSSSTTLDYPTLSTILDRGYSRIPIFKRRDKLTLLGYLLVKELAIVNPADAVMIEKLPLRKPLFVRPGLGLLELLRLFQEGRCHLAMVCEDPAAAARSFKAGRRMSQAAAVMGIVTLEDVLEKLIQTDIRDETDTPHRAHPTLLYHGFVNGTGGRGLVGRGTGLGGGRGKESVGLLSREGGGGGSRGNQPLGKRKRRRKGTGGQAVLSSRSNSSGSGSWKRAVRSGSSDSTSDGENHDCYHYNRYPDGDLSRQVDRRGRFIGGIVRVSRSIEDWSDEEIGLHPEADPNLTPTDKQNRNGHLNHSNCNFNLHFQSSEKTDINGVEMKEVPSHSEDLLEPSESTRLLAPSIAAQPDLILPLKNGNTSSSSNNNSTQNRLVYGAIC